MKILMLIAGVLAVLLGMLWMGQGMGYVHWPADSSMISNMRWTYIGTVLAIVGVGLAVYAMRRSD